MSRPTSSHATRPQHIALPTSPFVSRSPNGSPQPLPSAVSPTSPRASFLPSFMRTRSRAQTVTQRGQTSPTNEMANPLGGSGTVGRGHGSRDTSVPPAGRDGGGVTRSVSTPVSGGLANGSTTTRSLASTIPVPTLNPQLPPSKTYRIRLVPHLETARSLAFDPVVRELLPIHVPGGVTPTVAAASVTSVGPAVNGRAPALLLKIGRFTDKGAAQLPVPGNAGGSSSAGGTLNGSGGSGGVVGGTGATVGMAATLTIAGGGGDLCSGKVAFKSKVVSRSHAEIWCEEGGKFFIRDTSSSSGTFLNHIRLSSPNTDSRATPINDGDVLQLGVDYQGGHEDMFRCVKMRVEIGREWQRGANEFNTNALKQLKALGGGTPDGKGKTAELSTPSAKKHKASVTDCCICLFSVTVCQSLFIAPCSHVFHYKCIRPLLQQHHPGFSCPLCRTFANLEEDVETEDAWEIASRRASIISRRPSNHSIRLPPTSDGAPVQPGSDAPDGPPSSGVGFGPAAASVDELLAGGSTSGGGESGTASDDDLTGEGEPLARGRTIVPQPADGSRSDVEMGDGSEEGPTIFHIGEPILRETPLAQPIVHRNGPPVGLNLVGAGGDGTFDALGDDTQTPRNETFLSTLAGGASGMQQRFDLGRQMDEVSARQPETVVEGRAAEQEEQEDETERTRRTEADRRDDVEMMFS